MEAGWILRVVIWPEPLGRWRLVLVVSRELIINVIVLGCNRNGRVGLVEGVHGYLISLVKGRRAKDRSGYK